LKRGGGEAEKRSHTSTRRSTWTLLTGNRSFKVNYSYSHYSQIRKFASRVLLSDFANLPQFPWRRTNRSMNRVWLFSHARNGDSPPIHLYWRCGACAARRRLFLSPKLDSTTLETVWPVSIKGANRSLRRLARPTRCLLLSAQLGGNYLNCLLLFTFFQ
jgi:hypothetical protein